jgi:glycosyltransferase involved in cell wall biosynthesis
MNSVPIPRVSIVIPNYNHARFLRKRVDSVLRQTFQDFELILLDDCSSDDSCSILASYASDSRIRMEFNSVNSGSTFKQWNKGVNASRGEYIWIAESDDYADEKMLERLVKLLESEPNLVFAYCRSWRVLENDRRDGFADDYLTSLDPHRWSADYYADGEDECRNFLAQRNTIPNASAVVFRRAAYHQVGGADESFQLCADWKLWAALALTGRIAYLGEPLNYFRFHGSSVRNRAAPVVRNVAEPLRVIRWIQERVALDPAIREKLCEKYCFDWVPAVLSSHLSFAVKRSILRDVIAIDRHVLRRVFRPALATIRMKLARHFHLDRVKR